MTGIDENRLTEVLRSVAPTDAHVAFNDVARRVRHRRTLRWSVVGSAGAVAVLAVCVALLGPAMDRRSSLPAATHAADPYDVIAWVGTPAQPYRPPTLPTPTAAPSNARPCTSADVTARFGHPNGAGGHLLFPVTFRNTSRSTCVLKGYPHVTATRPGSPGVPATTGSYFDTGERSANMSPGGQTQLGLETDTVCASRPGGRAGGPVYHHVDIVVPGGGTVSLDGPAEGLALGCGLHLTRFFVDLPVQRPRDRMSALSVTLETPTEATAGTTMRFIADLTNPTAAAIKLERCPGYLQSAGAVVKQTYALNCEPVGAIAAHRTVRFAMRLRLPADTPTGPLTVRWAILGPFEGASATVDITAAPTSSPS